MTETSKHSFEDDMTRLSEIAAKLEDEEVSLEDSISLFEEGINLSQKCLKQLSEAELKVTELKKKFKLNADKLDDLEE